jgi:hypothetical protein
MEMQSVSFEEIETDNQLTVYQARIADPAAPGAPVYALTATTVKPASTEERTALEEVLNQMRAAFTLQDKPVPKEPDTPDPFDPQHEIRFEASVISIGGKGPVTVAMTVEATMGDDEITTEDHEVTTGGDGVMAAAGELARATYPITLPKNRKHHWHSISGYKTQATVNVSLGAGTLSPAPSPPNPIGPGPTYRTSGITVVVQAAQRLNYTLGGSFNYPPT